MSRRHVVLRLDFIEAQQLLGALLGRKRDYQRDLETGGAANAEYWREALAEVDALELRTREAVQRAIGGQPAVRALREREAERRAAAADLHTSALQPHHVQGGGQ